MRRRTTLSTDDMADMGADENMPGNQCSADRNRNLDVDMPDDNTGWSSFSEPYQDWQPYEQESDYSEPVCRQRGRRAGAFRGRQGMSPMLGRSGIFVLAVVVIAALVASIVIYGPVAAAKLQKVVRVISAKLFSAICNTAVLAFLLSLLPKKLLSAGCRKKVIGILFVVSVVCQLIPSFHAVYGLLLELAILVVIVRLFLGR